MIGKEYPTVEELGFYPSKAIFRERKEEWYVPWKALEKKGKV